LATAPFTSESPLSDPAVPALLKEAAGARDLPHSGRSFIEHLVGTWWILGMWGMPRAVCRAGLAHSCYSTIFYPHALFDLGARPRVRALIGRGAEALAYRFCVIDRAELWTLAARLTSPGGGLKVRRIDDGRPVFLPAATVRSLLVVESANLAEQSAAGDGSPEPWMSRLASWSKVFGRVGPPLPRHLAPTLTGAAERRALEKYRLALKAPLSEAPALLDDALRLNPWAGEPRILRALCALDRRDWASAFSHAAQGQELLSAWAVTWDKRLKLREWLGLADLVMRGAAGAARPAGRALSFRSVRAALNGAGGRRD
jgi:hypothetical protein